MHNKVKRILATGLLAATLGFGISGCANVGREFPAAYVSSIKIGQTTRDDIRNTFGEPWRTGMEDGRRTWTYGDYHYSAFGPEKTRDLVVKFDDQGKVVSYTYNSTYPEDQKR